MWRLTEPRHATVPKTILREAVINALVHADYSQRGAPFRVAFFDDRIEIENPGIFLPGMTVEDMRQGVSKIRNHVIARVFRELNLIEQWGSGVRRMFKEAQEQGLPEPQILEVGMRVRFVVWLAQEISTEQVTEQVARFLECLKAGPLSSREAMQRLELQHRPTFLYDYLQPALKAGLVEMTQPDSPKSPSQKYRLTTNEKPFP